MVEVASETVEIPRWNALSTYEMAENTFSAFQMISQKFLKHF